MAAVWLNLLSVGWSTPAPDVKAELDRAAESEGADYAVARDKLASRGKAIAPLLREMARSPDWRHWSLAQTLLMQIDEPEQVARRRWALTPWHGDATIDNDGMFAVRFGDNVIEQARKEGVRLTGREVRFGREAIPVILDFMREMASNSQALLRAAAALEHLAEPRTARPILYFSAMQSGRREAEIVEVLTRIGPAALPALREAVRQGDGDFRDGLRAGTAARVLGAFGDPSSARVLIDMLDRLTLPDSIPIFCEAIRRIGVDEGPEVVLSQLFAAGEGWPGRQFPRTVDTGIHRRVGAEPFASVYAAIRAEVLAFGPAIKPAVMRRMQPDAPLLTRAIAEGVAYELGHAGQMHAYCERLGRSIHEAREAFPRYRPAQEAEPDFVELGYRRVWSARQSESLPAPSEIPVPLRIEQTAIWPDALRLQALGDLKGNRLAFEVCRQVLLEEPYRRRQQPEAVLALAKVGGVEALDVYLRRLEEHSVVDYEAIIEALVFIGDPRGVGMLQAIIERERTARFSWSGYRAVIADARAVLPLLRDAPERLAELLDAPSPSLRLSVARALAARGDPRAVPVLFEVAAAALPDPAPKAGRRPMDRQADHRRARDPLVALGPAALPALQDAAARSEEAHAALLAESVARRITRPQLEKRFTRAAILRSPGFNHMLGPAVADYRATGVRVAERLDAEAVPLLEAAIVWQADSVLPGVAAFALAQFRQERSFDLLLACTFPIGSVQDGSLRAAALLEFGPGGHATLFDAAERHADLEFRAHALAGLTSAGYKRAFEPAARLFLELADKGLEDPRRQPVHDALRPATYQFIMWTLAEAMLDQDAVAAYPRIARALHAPNMPPQTSKALTWQLHRLRRSRPELAEIDVPLLPPGAGTDLQLKR